MQISAYMDAIVKGDKDAESLLSNAMIILNTCNVSYYKVKDTFKMIDNCKY